MSWIFGISEEIQKKNISERSFTQSEIPLINDEENCKDDSLYEGDDSITDIEGYEIEMNSKMNNNNNNKYKKEETNKDTENDLNEGIN